MDEMNNPFPDRLLLDRHFGRLWLGGESGTVYRQQKTENEHHVRDCGFTHCRFLVGQIGASRSLDSVRHYTVK